MEEQEPAEEDEMAFAPGHHVGITIMGPIQGQDGFQDGWKVQSADGSVWNLTRRQWSEEEQNPAELTFTPWQRVTVTAGENIGQQGAIVGPIQGRDGWQVQLDSGWIVGFSTQNLQTAVETSSASSSTAMDTTPASVVEPTEWTKPKPKKMPVPNPQTFRFEAGPF